MNDKYIDDALKNIGEQPLPDDFSQKLHIKLVEAANQKKKFNLKPLINIAVSVAAVIAIAFGINTFEYKNDYTMDIETADMTPKTVNEPVAVAETKRMESAMYDSAKMIAIFGEYEINLKGNVKVLNQLKEIADIENNEIICDQTQFDKIYEILLNNDIELVFNYQRDSDNLIIIK